MSHRAEGGAADSEFQSSQPDHDQALPVRDEGSTGTPAEGDAAGLRPDGSAWEAEDSEEEWEDKFIADPDAAAEATRERMAEQFEGEKAAAGVPDDPPVADSVETDRV